MRPERPFTGVSGPSGSEIAKSLNKSLPVGLQKSPRKYLKSQKIPQIGLLGVFSDLFGCFLGLFCRPPPKRLLFRLFAISGPEGPETPVNGR